MEFDGVYLRIFVLIVVLLLLSFGDPRHIFYNERAGEVKLIVGNKAEINKCETVPNPHMPTPPPHITRGFPRAPSLHSPYPKNPIPLGFEFTSTLPSNNETSHNPIGNPPYPLAEINEMPQPMTQPIFATPNELAYIEDQIVREVASDNPSVISRRNNALPSEPPPPYSEVVNEDSSLRNRFRY